MLWMQDGDQDGRRDDLERKFHLEKQRRIFD